MTDFTALLGVGFRRSAPSNLAEIASLETTLGVSLPLDYKDFLAWSDGGEGEVGDLYLSMWTVVQAVELNALYSITTRMGRGFVGIGTDGGDYCFALDLRRGERFVVVPLGALAEDEVKPLASDLVSGLTSIRDGRITGNDL
ncbi:MULTISPECIES: SMI1/KNR4 family protein [unclassified Burkholderia]|uniref:SMI1/KNR4 family protein n=1 Tax=unclassified Burkholderia TaxID=2613784 RepID=UPI000F599DF5|nr:MULTISPECIES: SMI1/KNR4 family protein [unclassified Burkholderia]RQS50806.1 SMI1/KNR4 family protein [Burkholderia sp. Bp8986]